LEKENKLKSQPKQKKWNVAEIAQKTINAASALASALVLLREKPRPLDWLAIGMAVTNVGITIHNEIKKHKEISPFEFYDPDFHELVSPSMKKVFTELCEEVQVIAKQDKVEIFTGTIGGADISWRKWGKSIDIGPFFNKEDKDKIFMSIRNKLWKSIGGKNARLTGDGTIGATDESYGYEIHETTNLKSLKERVVKFLDAEITRSFLLEGEPGTGKTSAILYLINKLELTSFRTTISELTGGRWEGQAAVAKSLEGLLMALKPDVLVLDDIDRSYLGQDGLLKLFEVARNHCRLIIATVNNKDNVVGAMLRVGRFDDHLKFEGVDVEVLKVMLEEEDYYLIDRFKEWPIAYIQNFLVVKKVLGRDLAIEEVESMQSRIKKIKKKTEETEKKKKEE
jgi:hypothetical protein